MTNTEIPTPQWKGAPFGKKIEVLCRNFAKQFVCEKPWVAISVSTERADFPQLSVNNRRALLRLHFWDISKPSPRQIAAGDLKLFSDNQAKEIISFVKSYWDEIDTLMVHCEAGVSRSPAIAAAIANIMYGAGAEEHWFENYAPNRYVYRKILQAHYTSGDFSLPETEEVPEGVENILNSKSN